MDLGTTPLQRIQCHYAGSGIGVKVSGNTLYISDIGYSHEIYTSVMCKYIPKIPNIRKVQVSQFNRRGSAADVANTLVKMEDLDAIHMYHTCSEFLEPILNSTKKLKTLVYYAHQPTTVHLKHAKCEMKNLVLVHARSPDLLKYISELSLESLVVSLETQSEIDQLSKTVSAGTMVTVVTNKDPKLFRTKNVSVINLEISLL